ncbi:hypothetical protein F5Y13DRAFT_193525 [Hypoxylon sp. FL1857]|nr:hypothetical protein F5Y13DRAFT_193525 [Hypoxylon sp. FL1857]
MSLNEVPALILPSGEVSNVPRPPNRNAEAHAGIIICLILTSSAVLVRAYSRIFFIAFAAFWDIPLGDVPMFFHIYYIALVLYELTMMGLKISILTEWIHLFVPCGIRNTFFWACLVVMLVNVLYYTASILSVSFGCTPRAEFCARFSFILIFSAVINLTSDLVILVLPIRTIWLLKLSRRKKLSVSLIFALGILCCIAAAVRLAKGKKAFVSPDKTYTLSPVTLWCLAEATCAFLVFCAPAAPMAFKANRLEGMLPWGTFTADQPRNRIDIATYPGERPSFMRKAYMRDAVPFRSTN